MANSLTFEPKLDLVFERTTLLSAEKIWEGWTRPETLMKWFCPRPWRVTECRIEPRPGGEFYTLMEGPGGEKMPNHGCFLEVIPNQKLVWTGMMTKGFRPVETKTMGFGFVATILLTKNEKVTRYKAHVAHVNEAGRKQHEQMGFQEGWGLAFDQLVELFQGGVP